MTTIGREADKFFELLAKWNFLLNGGALVAILALIGQSLKSNPIFAQYLIIPAIIFLVGLIITWYTMYKRMLGFYQVLNSGAKTLNQVPGAASNNFNKSYVSLKRSLVTFIVGAIASVIITVINT